MSFLSPCPVMTALSVIGGKWKPIILWVIRDGSKRFSEIKRDIPPISQKMLIQHLRELESDGIIKRRIYPVIPPKVEYSLSPYGRTLRPMLDAIATWGESHQHTLARKPAPVKDSSGRD